jgi:hypothetical protein
MDYIINIQKSNRATITIAFPDLELHEKYILQPLNLSLTMNCNLHLDQYCHEKIYSLIIPQIISQTALIEAGQSVNACLGSSIV